MSDAIGELLAVIHGDGGHYRAQHGTDKACLDALSIIYKLRAKPTMPSDRCLPSCMMPDGAAPCQGYSELQKENAELWEKLSKLLPGTQVKAEYKHKGNCGE